MQVTYLGNQLGEACSFNSQLTALLEQRDHKIASLKEHAAQLKHKCTVRRDSAVPCRGRARCHGTCIMCAARAMHRRHHTCSMSCVPHRRCCLQAAERELSAAYSEVASLQAQLGERDDEIGQLHDSMRNEAQQWVSRCCVRARRTCWACQRTRRSPQRLRISCCPPCAHRWQAEVQCALHDSLAAKEGEVVALNQALQRMEAALRAVEHMLYGARKPRRVDRASLDAVSIQQLQAAVEQFAAVGSSDSSAAHHGSSRHPP